MVARGILTFIMDFSIRKYVLINNAQFMLHNYLYSEDKT
jgi:hypothetical protein